MRYTLLFFFLIPLLHFGQINITPAVVEINFGGDSEPKDLTKIDNKIFFTAVSTNQDILSSRKVFVKQNLTSQAIPLSINNNQYNSISIIGKLGSVVFIIVEINYNTDKQLWRTDGTQAGTYLVKSITGSANTDLTRFNFLNDKFFFSYYNTNSHHLWASDGTSANTNQIGSFTTLTDLSNINGNIVFSTQNNNNNTVIYKSNGTSAGTTIINSFPAGVYPIYQIVSSSSFFYFLKSQNGSSQLCKSDLFGTITVIKNLQQFETNLKAAFINNKLVFSTRENINGLNSSVLNSYDEIDNLISTITIYPFISNIIPFNNKVYFDITDSNNNYSIASSDGTVNGTQNVTNIYNIPNLYLLQRSKDSKFLIFQDTDDSYLLDEFTILPRKIIKESPSFEFNNLLDFTFYDNFNVLFAGKNKKNGNELFINSNNTSTLLEDVNHFGGTPFVNPIELNGKVIFFGGDYSSGSYEPTISDGTTSGTKIIKDLNPGGFGSTHSSDNPAFFKNGNKLFFRCSNEIATNEPCVTDGTETGTKLIKKLSIYNNGSLATDPYFMHLNDNEVLFAADGNNNNSTGDYNLWKTDGTEVGTVFVHSVYPSKGTYDHKISSAKINSYVYFTGQTDLNDNPSIWKTDGSTIGTQFVKSFPIPTNNYYYFPKIIAQYNNKLFIIASHWSASSILYMYDTNTDTLIQLRVFSSISPNFHTNNNNLYFIADNKLLTVNLITNQIFESSYNTGMSNYVSFKQCNDNLFVHLSDVNMYNSSLFLINNQNSQQVILPDGAITASTCINEKLLYVSRTTTSLVQKVIKITDGNNFTNINLLQNNQSIDFINYPLNNVSDVFKAGNYIYFHLFIPQLNYDGSELYSISNLNQFLNSKEENISYQNNQNTINIYPNPTSDYININSNKKITLKNIYLYDISGKEILIKTPTHNRIDLSNLPSGVYIIKIMTDIGTFNKKILKIN